MHGVHERGLPLPFKEVRGLPRKNYFGGVMRCILKPSEDSFTAFSPAISGPITFFERKHLRKTIAFGYWCFKVPLTHLCLIRKTGSLVYTASSRYEALLLYKTLRIKHWFTLLLKSLMSKLMRLRHFSSPKTHSSNAHARCLIFCRTLRLLPYFTCVNS